MKRHFVFILLVWAMVIRVSAQGWSTSGVDFWTAMPQHAQYTNLNDAYTALSVCARRNCVVTVSIPLMNWSTQFVMTANSRHDVTLPMGQCYMTATTTTPQNKGIHITATDEVSVIAYSHASTSMDAAGLLPVSAMGSEYMIQTGSPHPHPSGNHHPSFFCVIAPEDGTSVTVYPSNEIDYGGGVHSNQPFTVQMSAGQVLYVKSYNYSTDAGDLSGTRIVENGGKKIAVLNGNQLLVIPQGCNSGDFIYEQAYPTVSWGREFVVSRTLNRCSDYVKITASTDHDSIRKNGNLLIVLQEGQSFQFELTQDVAYLKTSEQSAVYLYMASNSHCPEANIGGPSMVWIPPMEQSIDTIDCCSLSPSPSIQGTITQVGINIVTRSSNMDSIQMNGTSMPLNFTTIPGSPYSYARSTLTEGNYQWTCGGDGMVAHIYGQGVSMSYAYLAGSRMRHINRRVEHVDTICLGDTAHFEIESWAGDTIYWDFDDGDNAVGGSADHFFGAPGDYQVTANIYASDGQLTLDIPVTVTAADTLWLNHDVDCNSLILIGGMLVNIRRDTTIYLPHPTRPCTTMAHTYHTTAIDVTIDTMVCVGSFLSICDTVISDAGTYHFSKLDGNGCLTQTTLNVVEMPTYHLQIDTSLCRGDELYFMDQTIVASGDYIFTHPSSEGCDSIIELHVTAHSRSVTEIYDTLSESTYQFGDRTLYSAGEYEQRLTNYVGCDSLVTLHLWAEPCRLWVPNVFTPDEETNNRFVIFGCGLLQADVWIFDRGGDFVAHFDGLTESWDGTHNGTPCKVGSYIYRIAYRCTDDTHYEHIKVGIVTLLR